MVGARGRDRETTEGWRHRDDWRETENAQEINKVTCMGGVVRSNLVVL